MTDKKLMQWLKICANDYKDGCPYKYKNLVYRVECKADLMNDALEPPKEQEPVKTEPVRFRVFRAGAGNYPFWDCVCDGCGFKTSTVHTNWRFCPEYGRAVKWNERQLL